MYSENVDRNTLMVAKLAVYGVIALIVLALIFGSFGTVEAGERGVKTRLGAVTGEVIEPGLYLKLPFIERVNIIEVRTQTISFEKKTVKDKETNTSLGAASRDLQDVSISVVVNYHIDPRSVQNIYQQYRDVETYQTNVLEPRVRDIVKNISPQYTAEELITKRGEFNDKVTRKLVDEMLKKESISEQVNITNIAFSAGFTNAIEAKVTAVQEAETAKNQLERIKYEAQQNIEKSKGEAEAIRVKSISLEQSPNYIELEKLNVQREAIRKWSGNVPTTMVPGSTVPFINLNTLNNQ